MQAMLPEGFSFFHFLSSNNSESKWMAIKKNTYIDIDTVLGNL